MIRKYLFLPAALTLAMLLMAGSVAQAQHRGGGHPASHGGGHAYHGTTHAYHGTAHYYHSGGHAYYGGTRYYRGGRYYTGGFGLYPSYWYGGSGYPYYSYDYPYYYPSSTYYYPPYDYVAPTTTTTSAYYSADDTATVRVIVPNPQATVWFNGTLTQQTGTDRSFYTPPLTMGSNYSYTIRAAWMEGGQRVTQERTISVAPGGNYLVDFSRAAVPGS